MQAVHVKSKGAGADKVLNKVRSPLSPPTTIELRGVRINFPFRPYECQIAYMGTVLDALFKKENALLESPTGTGKTLCLLCATLAWQRQQARLLQQASDLNLEENALSTSSQHLVQPPPTTTTIPTVKTSRRIPTIIYASRTHSQLSQVLRELRNTRYRPKHTLLGSREQMCINPKVKRLDGRTVTTATDINHQCNKLGKERQCYFRNNLENISSFHGGSDNTYTNNNNNSHGCCGNGDDNAIQPVRDMEDLIQMGHEMKICPFYYTRAQVEGAELILVPYNYLFDKEARESTLKGVEWDNTICIFDEAHNLESFASDSASFDLTSLDIANCLRETGKVINYLESSHQESVGEVIKIDNIKKINALFKRLEDYIMALGPQSAYSGQFIMDVFKQGFGIVHGNYEFVIVELRKVNEFLMDIRGSNNNRGSPSLEHFIQCLKLVFGHTLESRCLAMTAFYRVHVSSPTITDHGKHVGRTISYWCFAPSVAMQELSNLKIRSVLVTSGTLSPLPSYSMELGLPFPHTLENPHIIGNDQIYVRVVGKGVSGKVLSSSYERRNDKDYFQELGNTLVSLAKVTPAGMLVFFPSYSVMEMCLKEWGGPILSSPKNYSQKNDFFAKRSTKTTTKNPYSFPFAAALFAPTTSGNRTTTPWKRLLSTKSVVLEPRSSADLPDAMTEFKRFLDLNKSTGCILMGVCRGKISEGIDFSNEQSRAVVITGLPFPPSHDPKVKMKREYLDGTRAQNRTKACGDGGFGMKAPESCLHNKLSGHEWYTQQAHRAVNQAIGRVIRNKDDYGAVLLLDTRFGQPQNQVGLSKWLQPHLQKDEGIGTAIHSLAQFYKKAQASAAQREEVNKRLQATTKAIVPTYDEEEENQPTKLAVVRQPQHTIKKEIGESIHDSFAYVDPKQVVVRIDVNDQTEKLQHPTDNINKIQSINTKAIKTNDAVFRAKPLASTVITNVGDKSNLLAQRLMNKLRDKLTISDQSMIRRAIVAMKDAGEKLDTKAYLNSAQTVVDLIVRCERFELYNDTNDNNDDKMLFLLFGLLPKTFRSQVEIMSFEVVFVESSFGQYCKENLDLSLVEILRSRVGRLLQSVWCRKYDVPLPTEEYLRKTKEIFDTVLSSGNISSPNSMLVPFIKLVPKTFQSVTRSFAADRAAATNIQRMKEADKNNKGEDSIDVSLFRSVVLNQTHVHGSERSVSSLTEDRKSVPLKRKLDEKTVAINKNKSSDTVNPYTRKKIIQPNTSKNSHSLSSILQKVETEKYIPPDTARQVAQSISTNAPHDILCPICSIKCEKPFVADCGHIACLRCWTTWLQRHATCMTCRNPTIKESLARLVYYKNRPGQVVPTTLAQLCASTRKTDEVETKSDEDDDGELEIGD